MLLNNKFKLQHDCCYAYECILLYSIFYGRGSKQWQNKDFRFRSQTLLISIKINWLNFGVAVHENSHPTVSNFDRVFYLIAAILLIT
jgi:hypothetical protein